MENCKRKAYMFKIVSACQAIKLINSWREDGQETAQKIWQSIVQEVALVFVFFNQTKNPYILWEDELFPDEILAFRYMITKLIVEKEDLAEMDLIKVGQFLPTVMKVATGKVFNFQDWKEGDDDDDLKQDVALLKKDYNLYMKFIKKSMKSKEHAEMVVENLDPDPALTKTLTRPIIAKNKKNTKSTLRQYQCPYGCMKVFLKKNDLFRHQIETNRACKYNNADKLPVKPLPQSEATLLDMIGEIINKLNDSSLFSILSDDVMDFCIATLNGIKGEYNEGKDESYMNTNSDSDDQGSSIAESSSDVYESGEN